MVVQLRLVYLTFVSALVSSHLPVNVVVQTACSFHPDISVEGNHTPCRKLVALYHQNLTVVTRTQSDP